MKEVPSRVLLLIVCGLLCTTEGKYKVKPVLFINLTQAGADTEIADGCELRVNKLSTNPEEVLSIEAAGLTESDECGNNIATALGRIDVGSVNHSGANRFLIAAHLGNSTDKKLCESGLLRHRQGILSYHCPKENISFFFDRFKWWALLTVVGITVFLTGGSIVACYVDCVNRRTTMPASANDNSTRTDRDHGQSVRREELQRLLDASMLRHRIREAEAERTKDRRTKRAERRKRMTKAQMDVSERSSESHHSEENPKSPMARKDIPFKSNPGVIHEVVNEKAKNSSESKREMKYNEEKRKDAEQSCEDSNTAKVPLLPISKIAPPANAASVKHSNDILIDSIELTKDKRPEVLLSNRNTDEDVLLTCEEDDVNVQETVSTSPEQS
ncbi:hypothetical protein QR680_018033 [Steinernema hermaphroditum]|uniref:ZP domain-containing protein n=1 Tax=Steinernema hermaphroditum TaxID=289476 RepID=A0AA39LQD3_9BILA|nr:hypothetical protein QR680_018033 [Steinernema hermaphroditum]